MSQKKRFEEFDFLRGAAIVMVVFGHAIIGLTKAGIYGKDVGVPDTIVLTFYCVHMAMIFFVSGLVSNECRKTASQFLSENAQWIIYPYVLWTIVTVFVQKLSPSANNPVPLVDLLSIAWSPIMLFWFLHTLFLVKASTFLGLKTGLTPFRAAFTIAATCLAAFPLLPESAPQLLKNFVGFLFFYQLGILVSLAGAEYAGRFAAEAGRIAIAAFAGFAAVVAVTKSGWLGAPRPIDGTQITLHAAGVWGITGFAAVAILLRGTPASAALALCGRYSMAIYVQHTILVAAGRLLLLRLGLTDPVAATLACGAFGVLLPILGQKITDRLGWSAWLGIRPVDAPVAREAGPRRGLAAGLMARG
jgi:fucose 4-O-acetylase-like acetyltransferase